MQPIYEVVSGQILLSHRQRFFELHSVILLPIMREIGIEPKMLLIIEIGRYGRFLDIYRYPDLAQYEILIDKLLSDPRTEPYYAEVGHCVHGSISVGIMIDLPYATDWKSSVVFYKGRN
jgi:hypothetical protein